MQSRRLSDSPAGAAHRRGLGPVPSSGPVQGGAGGAQPRHHLTQRSGRPGARAGGGVDPAGRKVVVQGSRRTPVGSARATSWGTTATPRPVATQASLPSQPGTTVALPSVLQTRVLAVAPFDTALASAWYVAAFNAGIGGGALLGAVLLDRQGPRAVA